MELFLIANFTTFNWTCVFYRRCLLKRTSSLDLWNRICACIPILLIHFYIRNKCICPGNTPNTEHRPSQNNAWTEIKNIHKMVATTKVLTTQNYRLYERTTASDAGRQLIFFTGQIFTKPNYAVVVQTLTVVPVKSDSGVMFCLQSYQDL